MSAEYIKTNHKDRTLPLNRNPAAKESEEENTHHLVETQEDNHTRTDTKGMKLQMPLCQQGI